MFLKLLQSCRSESDCEQNQCCPRFVNLCLPKLPEMAECSLKVYVKVFMLLSAIRVPDDSARKRFPFHASGIFPRVNAGYERVLKFAEHQSIYNRRTFHRLYHLHLIIKCCKKLTRAPSVKYVPFSGIPVLVCKKVRGWTRLRAESLVYNLVE